MIFPFDALLRFEFFFLEIMFCILIAFPKYLEAQRLSNRKSYGCTLIVILVNTIIFLVAWACNHHQQIKADAKMGYEIHINGTYAPFVVTYIISMLISILITYSDIWSRQWRFWKSLFLIAFFVLGNFILCVAVNYIIFDRIPW